ncbi:hypothetical protein KGO04_01525 [Patescibacteria group bacterium]|nr:hypothetical protein [Patescibacteria group bacterium]
MLTIDMAEGAGIAWAAQARATFADAWADAQALRVAPYEKGVPGVQPVEDISAGARYFGFAIADGMFPSGCNAVRRALSVEEVTSLLAEPFVSCCNPQHRTSLDAARRRFGLEIPVPEKAQMVSLKAGDEVVVMSVRGLPRLEENRHEYTEEEIARATFVFGLWTVVS